jgi:hypothetical protein
MLMHETCEAGHGSVDIGMDVGRGQSRIPELLLDYEVLRFDLLTVVSIEMLDGISSWVVIVACVIRDH